MKKWRFVLLLLLSISITLPSYAQRNKKKNDAETESAQEEKYFLDDVSLSGLKFRSIGPALTSGRISDFAVHPENRSVYYVATSSGGVWKTVNGGATYEPIFDSQGSYSIGCITMAPNNPNVIWVGTGENNNQRAVAYGDGVYKSEDGGRSWKHMGLKNSEHIGKIIVHPDNSDVVYVAAIGPLWSSGGDRGVYKTTDGGKNWELILELDEHTGATDLIMDPRDPDLMYAAAHQRRRHVFTYVGGGPGSGIYKTTDGGKNWTEANRGLPGGDKGRMAFAQSPADPEIIYLMVEAQTGSGVFRSTNRGASWEKRSNYFTRGNYYSEIVAHPTDPDVVYAMDTYMMWSTDGGRTFEQVGETFKHVDNHALWIDPEHTNYYLVGCDGGIYESFDAGTTWIFKPNLPVTQFYKVAVDNAEPFYNVYGGTQDNFSLGGPSRTRNRNGIVNSDWFITTGGDGFESQIDPRNPNIVYAQSQYGGLVRFDRASGERVRIQPQPREGEKEYRWNWDAPLTVSEHLDTRLYFAANKIFRSDDRGNSWEVVSDDLTRQIDRNTLPVMGRVQSIDAVAKNESTSQYGTLVAFSESPIDENLLYAGSDDGLIHVTTDGGRNWRRIDCNAIPGVPERTYVNALLASQHDVNVVYAVFNHHKYGDFKPYVFKSADQGMTWTDISSNLPERGSAYTIAEDHVAPGLLFVGTEFSCFTSLDGGMHWKKLSAGLPTVAVRDIAIQKRENDLVLATFGRGFYVLDDYSPLRAMTEEALTAEAAIFPVKPGLLYIEASPLIYPGNGFMGHMFYSADNPPQGATFTFHVKESVKTLRQERQDAERKLIKEGKDVSYPDYDSYLAEQQEEAPYLEMVIRDQAGSIVRKMRLRDGKGLRRATWSGRYPDLGPVRGNRPAGDGMMAMPGNYTVSLFRMAKGEMQELAGPVSFELKALGGVTLPAADRRALLAFQEEVAELQRVFSGGVSMFRDANARIEAMRAAVMAVPQPSPEWMADLQAMERKAYEIQLALYGDRNASTLDMPTDPSISGRMRAAGAGAGSTSAPTETMKQNFELAGKAFRPVLQQIKDLMQNDIRRMEEKLEAAGAPYTPGRTVDWSGN